MKVTEIVGEHYAFLTAGAMHHEIALQAIGADAPAQLQHAPGLYHVAFEVADKKSVVSQKVCWLNKECEHSSKSMCVTKKFCVRIALLSK